MSQLPDSICNAVFYWSPQKDQDIEIEIKIFPLVYMVTKWREHMFWTAQIYMWCCFSAWEYHVKTRFFMALNGYQLKKTAHSVTFYAVLQAINICQENLKLLCPVRNHWGIYPLWSSVFQWWFWIKMTRRLWASCWSLTMLLSQ